jgi:tRNA uridine 5-carboxymethylaminomethyl modification enzyme
MASRISGITPASISLLLIHLKRSRVKGFVSPGKGVPEAVENDGVTA